jgi:F-type H+-transporting ATPase subunit alpha
VGGAAQIEAMRRISGPLRVELAQYMELAAFAQFGSDLNPDTLARLNHGERIVEVFKQRQYSPMRVEEQVLILYMLTNKHFSAVRVDRVRQTERDFLRHVNENNKDILDEIRKKQAISIDLQKKIDGIIKEFMKLHGYR